VAESKRVQEVHGVQMGRRKRLRDLVEGLGAKKIYRLKEDQAFSLALELGRREKFARHPSADILLHSV
jgi:hypothetical protein